MVTFKTGKASMSNQQLFANGSTGSTVTREMILTLSATSNEDVYDKNAAQELLDEIKVEIFGRDTAKKAEQGVDFDVSVSWDDEGNDYLEISYLAFENGCIANQLHYDVEAAWKKGLLDLYRRTYRIELRVVRDNVMNSKVLKELYSL